MKPFRDVVSCWETAIREPCGIPRSRAVRPVCPGGHDGIARYWFNAGVQLTRRFRPEQYAQATESWRWLDLADKAPLFTSPFGDVFFQGADGFWWLDTLEGALTRPWRTADELRAELNTPEGQDQYLLGGLAAAAERRGIVPAENQIYDFTISPALGGPLDVDNIGVIDFVVGGNIAGQLHDQLRRLVPGTVIAGVTIDDGGRLRIST